MACHRLLTDQESDEMNQGRIESRRTRAWDIT
jgi:hypothetical protein